MELRSLRLAIGAAFLVTLSIAGCAGWRAPQELFMQAQQNPPKARPPVPEMVGATRAPFDIGPGPTQIALEMHPPSGPAAAAGGKREVALMIENVTCRKRAPSFRVYLNLRPGEVPEQHPEARAGNLGMFGLVESTIPEGDHGGDGLTFTLHITELFARLTAAKDWDSQKLRIVFDPAPWDAPVPAVRVGRVSLYFS